MSQDNENEKFIDIRIYYKPKLIDSNNIRIFGEKFVVNNEDKAKIIFNNSEYKLKSYFDFININGILLKLRIIKDITNMSEMFYGCDELVSFPDDCGNEEETIDDYNLINSTQSMEKSTENVVLSSNNNYAKKENSLALLNTSKVTDMSWMFSGCNSLKSLPDISKWNTSNVINISWMFDRCNSLESLPDISKWNTFNIIKLNLIFNQCNSLISLPSISKWNISKVTDMSAMFGGCNSLTSLPDISKWNTSNVNNMSAMFSRCYSLRYLPDISKWNISSVTNISYIFSHLSSPFEGPQYHDENGYIKYIDLRP